MSGKRQFTWQELASLNLEHNAHIAINGKVRKASRGPYYIISLKLQLHASNISRLTRDADSLLLKYIPQNGIWKSFSIKMEVLQLDVCKVLFKALSNEFDHHI